MSWYPQANKLLQKRAIFNEAINMHSRGPVEQHFYVWEPHCGCCLQAKKVQFYTPLVRGQQSNEYAFWRVNVAIKMKNVLVPPCSILLQHLIGIAMTGKSNPSQFVILNCRVLSLLGPGMFYCLKVGGRGVFRDPLKISGTFQGSSMKLCKVIAILKVYQNT